MKFVVSSTALLNVLQTSSKVVSNKNTLPILDNFLFDLKEGVLKITASDLETTLIGSLKVDNMEEEGLIAVPVKLMLDSLKEFSEQPLTIEANESTWEIQVSWKTGKLTIPGTSGLSYPNLPELNPESRRELDADADMLLTGINKTIFATADDELRPVMNGVYINIESQSITFVATDAHKLVKYVSPIETEIAASFILPKKPANLLRSMLGKEDESIRMEFDDKNVTFRLKSHTLICRLISVWQLPELQRRHPEQQPESRAGRPRRAAQRHPPRGRLLEPIYEPDQDGHRIEHDQPDGAGPGLFGIGPRIAGLRVRRRGYLDRFQIDFPRRDSGEYRYAKRRAGAG